MKITDVEITELEKKDVFTFRPLRLEDADTLYAWMHQKHIAPFWKLDLPMESFKEWVESSITAEHKDCYLVDWNGEPAGYLIAYRAVDDPVHHYYDYRVGDLGMHVLVGPEKYLNKQSGRQLLQSMIQFLFFTYETERIIGEPDIRNRIILPIMKGLGGEVLHRIHLPHKRAALIAGEKQTVEHVRNKRGIHVSFQTKEGKEALHGKNGGSK
ncbi:GNAT family N-acetyltransferase [Halobacillus litoralis]|uniref:GNAT family N-acetyltransferase n=1 Tax=Halobacillus litoralis TaxID=45668 RepID=UPI001CD442E7|nr:GNAT family N-acetyltransferase [Halobacillus litoralis]MCA1023524.1 acetyltransferase [Halobacillus litoralis]